MTGEEFLVHVQTAGVLAHRKEAERWSKTVAAALQQLLSRSEARRHFVSQLPGFLKSHLLAEAPHALLMSREALLEHIAAGLGTHVPEAERALRAVYGVLREAVSAGEIAELEAHVPRDVATFLAGIR